MSYSIYISMQKPHSDGNPFAGAKKKVEKLQLQPDQLAEGDDEHP
jgi:hypothetical protein